MYPFARRPAAPSSLSAEDHQRSLSAAYKMGQHGVSSEGRTFTVGLGLPEGKVLGVMVIMPNRFPNEGPTFRVNPGTEKGKIVRHPVLDGSGKVVRLPALSSWRPSTPVGDVLQALMSELQARLPTLESPPHVPGGVPGRIPAMPHATAGYPGPGPYERAAGGAPPAYGSPGGPGPSYPSGTGGPHPHAGAAAGGGAASYPSGGPPPYPTGPAGASGGPPPYAAASASASSTASSAAWASTRRSRQPPRVPDSFPALNGMGYPLLLVLQAEHKERREFCKKHVPEVATLRGSLLETLRSNREVAFKLAAGEGGLSRAEREELSSRLAVLLVDRSEAEEELRQRKRRVDAVAERLKPETVARQLSEKADAAREDAEGFGNRLRRGEGRPAGEDDGPGQRAWLTALVDGYIARRSRYHELAAKAALMAELGPPGPDSGAGMLL